MDTRRLFSTALIFVGAFTPSLPLAAQSSDTAVRTFDTNAEDVTGRSVGLFHVNLSCNKLGMIMTATLEPRAGVMIIRSEDNRHRLPYTASLVTLGSASSKTIVSESENANRLRFNFPGPNMKTNQTFNGLEALGEAMTGEFSVASPEEFFASSTFSASTPIRVNNSANTATFRFHSDSSDLKTFRQQCTDIEHGGTTTTSTTLLDLVAGASSKLTAAEQAKVKAEVASFQDGLNTGNQIEISDAHSHLNLMNHDSVLDPLLDKMSEMMGDFYRSHHPSATNVRRR